MTCYGPFLIFLLLLSVVDWCLSLSGLSLLSKRLDESILSLFGLFLSIFLVGGNLSLPRPWSTVYYSESSVLTTAG